MSRAVELTDEQAREVTRAARDLARARGLSAEHAAQLAVGLVLGIDPDDVYWGPPGHHTAETLARLVSLVRADDWEWSVEVLVHLNETVTVVAADADEAMATARRLMETEHPDAALVDPIDARPTAAATAEATP